jgi:2-oxoglutarate dehydrogenase E2 component (dihydrolipoamide succinyltransferase)
MASEIRVPQLGESVVEATVARWLKKEGEPVELGDAVVELETEKVNVEVAAEARGVLQQILHPEGDTVKVGDTIGMLDGADTAAPQPAATAGAQAAGAAAPAPAAPGPPAAAAGSAQAPPVSAAPVAKTPPEQPTADAADARAEPNGQHAITPVARRLAEEHGLDPAKVPGSGPAGRVMKEDVLALIQKTEGATAPAAPAEPPATGPAPAAAGREEERVRLSRRRQTIARRLVEAQQTAAMLTTFNEVDMSAVMEVRKRRRDSFRERHGVGLGFMSFFAKAAVGALKAFPAINAELQGEELVLKRYYDLGVAVSTEEGLVVPVLRDADRKTFAQIEQEIAALATRARERKLSLEDLRGGTFTLTNGGVFGSLLSTPILNPPQVGILGMHKIEERPVAAGGQVVIRPMMYLALTYDHRVVDGREAVSFLVRVKELIEDPEVLLLEG